MTTKNITLDQLASLVQIKAYLANSVAIPYIDRDTVKKLNKVLIQLDRKLCDILTRQDFTDLVNSIDH